MGSKVVQRTVLYLGEINDSQQAAWRKTLDVFDDSDSGIRQLALFPDDRPLPPDAVNALHLKLSEMRLLRPRSFGDCWLGCWLWLHREWFLASAMDALLGVDFRAAAATAARWSSP